MKSYNSRHPARNAEGSGIQNNKGNTSANENGKLPKAKLYRERCRNMELQGIRQCSNSLTIPTVRADTKSNHCSGIPTYSRTSCLYLVQYQKTAVEKNDLRKCGIVLPSLACARHVPWHYNWPVPRRPRWPASLSLAAQEQFRSQSLFHNSEGVIFLRPLPWCLPFPGVSFPVVANFKSPPPGHLRFQLLRGKQPALVSSDRTVQTGRKPAF